MGKRKLLLLLCLANAVASLAQQERRTLDWKDFTKSISETVIAKPVRSGEFTIFEIENINKFLYKVEMKGKVFELETPIPTELQTLFRLNPTELAQTANNEKSSEAVDKIEGQFEKMNRMSALMDDVVTNAARVAKAAPADRAASDRHVLAEELTALINTTTEKSKAYLKKSTDISEYVFELRKARNEYISIAQMDLPYSQIRNRAVNVPVPSVDVKAQYFALKRLYREVERQFNEVLTKAELIKVPDEIKSLIKKTLTGIAEADKLIDEEGLLGLLNEVQFLGEELQNRKNFLAVAPPVQMDGDFVSYTVTITPSATKTVGAHKSPVNFKFDIPAKGGWKADFSVGPVVSFGDNAKDEAYYAKEIQGTDSVTLEKQDNNNTISPGIAAMMHFYPRTGKNWAVGGLFGVGAGFQSVAMST